MFSKRVQIKPIKPNKDSLNITTIEDLVENYLESVGSRQKFSESTKKEYGFVSKLLQEFLDSKSIGINDINLIVALLLILYNMELLKVVK